MSKKIEEQETEIKNQQFTIDALRKKVSEYQVNSGNYEKKNSNQNIFQPPQPQQPASPFTFKFNNPNNPSSSNSLRNDNPSSNSFQNVFPTHQNNNTIFDLFGKNKENVNNIPYCSRTNAVPKKDDNECKNQ